MLDDIGLTDAIKWQLAEFEKRYYVNIRFEHNEKNLLIPDPVKTGLFRIFQEALINIGQHANAKNVVVSLLHYDNEALLIIEDDGKGFIVEEINSRKNLGFLGMKERCYMINASFDIVSSPGNGTMITITAPIE